jgi:hypothetical protein
VNGIVASPFAMLHELPNTMYQLVRVLYRAWPSAVESQWLQVTPYAQLALAQ